MGTVPAFSNFGNRRRRSLARVGTDEIQKSIEWFFRSDAEQLRNVRERWLTFRAKLLTDLKKACRGGDTRS
jgi:hypothetical protein